MNNFRYIMKSIPFLLTPITITSLYTAMPNRLHCALFIPILIDARRMHVLSCPTQSNDESYDKSGPIPFTRVAQSDSLAARVLCDKHILSAV